MDYYVATFNCHINNALEKAATQFKLVYSTEKFNKIIKPFITNGIMSIFDSPSTKYTKFFIYYLTDIVNDKRT